MATLVETRQGKVRGIEASGLSVFRGIPYAAPPVGARRWLPPAPAESWSGERVATAFARVCPQNAIQLDTLPILSIDQEMDEDCLFLNVWTPGCDDAKRPVMVWIHGGGFTIGAGSQLLSSAMPLATRGDVVVVSFNYRLGALGFLNLKEVTGGAIPATGNEGLLDQVAALRWVQENITRFGGDPDNVTIFGESAGGMSVGAQLALPSAAGLFHKAILQSGACHTANSLERAVRVAEVLTEKLGTRDPDALRGLPTERLLEAQAQVLPAIGGLANEEIGGMPLQPVIDGDVLLGLAIERVAGGSASGLPVLVGSTAEEWKLFGMADPSLATLDDATLVARLERVPEAAKLVGAYRDARTKRGAPATQQELYMAIQTDRVFRIPGVRLAEAQRAHEPRVYSYLVTWPSPLMGGILGACHAVDLGPLFGLHSESDALAGFFGSGDDADRLSVEMQEAWTAFARTGDPSCASLGSWPAYEPDRRQTMLLGATSGLESAPLDDERRAWDGVPDAALGSL